MEQWLPDYDSCRLFALNLFTFVVNPFTSEAYFDYDEFKRCAYFQQRLSDTLVDLEIEYVNRIISKIKNDPQPEEIKITELNLWNKVIKVAQEGRRSGNGFTALGDMLAALNMKYDSDIAISTIEKVCSEKMHSELQCSIDLAILRGSFPLHDFKREYFLSVDDTILGKNEFYQFILDIYPDEINRMGTYGRRNLSWSTVAPTGTVSLMTGTSSGLEPLFMPYYIRRKKINPNDAESRIDFIDQNGDKWQEFGVLHPKFKQWIQLKTQTQDVSVFNSSELDTLYIQSPWYKSCANDINWIKRIEIQSVIQKYTTNAISSTINLPEDVSVKEVSEIYMAAWKQGLKGVTVYRDNCRTGVLVNKDTVTKEVAFSQKDAVKRPELLTADVHVVNVKGVKYTVIVSVLEQHPYEVFVLTNTEVHCKKGIVHKASKNVYNFKDESGNICAENISKSVTNEEAAIARLISTSLRHGVDVRFLVEQLNKTEGANITSYTKAISRVLKTYIREGISVKEKCTECGQETMIYEEGCKKCKSCGHSKC